MTFMALLALDDPSNLNNTFGAVLIGLVVVAIFYGITCVQTYIYYITFPNDGPVLKSLIAFLWILDSLQLALVTHMLYHYLIKNYGNPSELGIIVWSFPTGTIITTIMNDGIIRCIYARRIWTLTKNKWSTGIVLVLTLAVVAGWIATSVHVFQSKTFEGLARIRTLISVCYSGVAFTDSVIAVILCANLLSRRSGFKKTDSQLQTLIKYAIHTALLTSIVAIASLITFLAMPHNLIYVATLITLPKLFLNSLLATLNARERLRERFDNIESVHLSKLPGGISVSSRSGSDPASSHHQVQPMMFDIGCVKVDKEQVQTRDLEDLDSFVKLPGHRKAVEAGADREADFKL
ncbi:hypothetical protein C8Q75DRAFT_493720 [Abortiporus biennis]|nr:hypothetical protein C8Q75DRAFT_493720 [Abortiporus biennis]